MLKDNIIGTLGAQICVYWRAALSNYVGGTWTQYSTQYVAENSTTVLCMDDNIGESSLEDVEILIVAPYLFGYCVEHVGENEDYIITLELGKWCLAIYR